MLKSFVVALFSTLVLFASFYIIPAESASTSVLMNGRLVKTGEYLFLWGKVTTEDEKRAELDRLGAVLLYRFRMIEADLVRLPQAAAAPSVAPATAGASHLRRVIPNYIVERTRPRHAKSPTYPYAPDADPLRHVQWWWYSIGADIALNYQRTGMQTPVRVGIVDSGAVLDHPDLRDNIRPNEKEYYGVTGSDDDHNGYVDDVWGAVSPEWRATVGRDPQDDEQQGTNIAGIIAARNDNNIGVSGIGNNVQLVLAKAINGRITTLASLLYGIEYCALNQAEFINMSWYLPDPDGLEDMLGQGDYVAIVSPGWGGYGADRNIEINRIYPASFNGPRIVTVTASNDLWSRFNNYAKFGPNTVDIAAPGESIYTTANTASTWNKADAPYDYAFGSDFATAIVTGTAALVKDMHPELSNLEVMRLIYDTVEQRDYLVGRVKNAGTINAARAVYGRAAGGTHTMSGWVQFSSGEMEPRADHCMVYDRKRNVMVLFGGVPAKNRMKVYGDTWEMKDGQWKQVATDGPKPRSFFAMAYDDFRQVTVLYGGRFVGEVDFSTWEWDGVAWKEIRTAHHPNEYRGVSMAWDQYNRRMLLVTPTLGRTWAYDGTDWTELKTNSVGKHQYGLSVAYDLFRRKLVLCGRSGMENGRLAYDHWEFNGSLWKMVGTLPGQLYGTQALVYDRLRKLVVALMAGFDDSRQSALYAIDANGVNIFPGRSLGFINSAAMAYDSLRALIVIQGGNATPAETGLTRGFYGRFFKDNWIDNLPTGASDYNGDGRADIALWRPENGLWIVSGQNNYLLGQRCDIPVPGDYNGDGKAEPAVWRRVGGNWITTKKVFHFGNFYDIPVPADYDGDGKTDVALWRPSDGTWLIKGMPKVQFGPSSGVPVPADYDGDGTAERAVFEPTLSLWFIEGQKPQFWTMYPGSSPVPADYDGDGKADLAVYYVGSASWYVRSSINGKAFIKRQFGGKYDIPVPGDYNGDGRAELATFNPGTGEWNIDGMGKVQVGRIGDVPLVSGR